MPAPEVQIMKKEQPGRVNSPVFIACRQLLKQVHVPQLDEIMFVDEKIEAGEEPVLVKIIVDDLSPEIHVQFVIQHP